MVKSREKQMLSNRLMIKYLMTLSLNAQWHERGGTELCGNVESFSAGTTLELSDKG